MEIGGSDISIRTPVHSLLLAVVNGKEIINIGIDGKVTLGEGVEVDDAARLFWDTVEKTAIADRATCPHCGKGMGD